LEEILAKDDEEIFLEFIKLVAFPAMVSLINCLRGHKIVKYRDIEEATRGKTDELDMLILLARTWSIIEESDTTSSWFVPYYNMRYDVWRLGNLLARILHTDNGKRLIASIRQGKVRPKEALIISDTHDGQMMLRLVRVNLARRLIRIDFPVNKRKERVLSDFF